MEALGPALEIHQQQTRFNVFRLAKKEQPLDPLAIELRPAARRLAPPRPFSNEPRTAEELFGGGSGEIQVSPAPRGHVGSQVSRRVTGSNSSLESSRLTFGREAFWRC